MSSRDTMQKVLDSMTRDGIAMMSESQKTDYLTASLTTAFELLRSVEGDKYVRRFLKSALHELETTKPTLVFCKFN